MKNVLTPRCVPDTACPQRNAPKSAYTVLIFVAFFSFLFPKNTSAQTSSSGAINKATDIPVSYHTGVPNISVPITIVTEGELSLGVSLSYNSSGIKVDELASPIGLGWALSAGGVISRQVVGGPDERQGFYTYYGIRIGLRDGDNCGDDPNCLIGLPPAGVTPACMLGTCLCECNYQFNTDCVPCHQLLETVHNETADVEPDIFTFNFGGYSGKFVFGNDNKTGVFTHTLHMMQANDLSVDFSKWDTQKQFIITDPKGVKYYFGNHFGRTAYEEVMPGGIPGASPHITSSAWYLVRVESPDGRHYIDLNYGPENYAYQVQGESQLTVDPKISLPGPGVPPPGAAETTNANNTFRNLVTGVRITGITTSSGIYAVNFGVGGARNDLNTNFTGGNAQILNNIQVINGGYCKNFVLTQSYFTATAPSVNNNDGAADLNRLRLDKVQEISCDLTTSVPPYVFTYNTTAIPPRSSLAKDVWGYYNGKDNNIGLLPTALPNIYNLPTTSSNYSYAYNTWQTNFPGDRTPDENKMKAGILEQITFPAGGNTKFTYEAHRKTPTDTKIYGGLRIKFLTSYTSDGVQATKTEYVYNQGLYFGEEPETGNYYRLNVRSNLEYLQLSGIDPSAGVPGYSKISSSLVYISSAPFRTLYGYHFGYSSVTVKRLDASTSTYSYSFQNYQSNSQGSVNYPYAAKVGIQDNVTLDKEEHKNAAGVTVQSTQFNYSFTELGRVDARKYYFYPFSNFSLYFKSNYQLVPYRKLLLSTTEILDGVTKTITYDYRADYAHLNPISITTTGSTGDMTQVTVKFPADITSSHPNFANVSTFLNRNMKSIPCETREYYNNNLVHGDVVEYQTIPHISGTFNIFVPFKYYRINRDCGIELRSTIIKIDADGKPIQVTHTGYNNTKYFYYQANNLLFRQTTRTATDSLSQSIAYDGTSSLPKLVTDVNGLLKKFTYDPLMRMSKLQDRMDANGNDVQATIDYQYQFASPFNFVGTVATIASGSGDPAKVLSTKQYSDGLGRSVELVKENYINITTINHQKTAMNYDALGRPDQAFQPFESSSLGFEVPSSSVPFRRPTYEASPLGRPLIQTAEDNSTVQIAYGANTTNEVFQFCTPPVTGSSCNNSPPGSIAPPVCSIISVNGFYAANALMKTTVTNENGKTTDVYTDKLGRVILMRKHLNGQNIDTYNVYDGFSDLIMVIPPGGLDGSNTVVPNICYKYTYDVVGRLITKKIPGAEILNYYYDYRDLITLMQDGNMRKTNYGGLDNGTKYLATIYDDFGRTKMTGWYYALVGENITQTALNFYIQSGDRLTQNVFYPNRTWLRDNEAKVLYAPGTTGARNYIWSYSERRDALNYKGNPVWQGRQHILSPTMRYGYQQVGDGPIDPNNDNIGIDWSVSVYNGAQQPNYASRVLASNNAAQNLNTINYFRYDNALRLDNINYAYNAQGNGWTPTKTLANLVYNFRDELIQKNIGKGDANNDGANNYLQNVDYLYNVRGWLTNINTFDIAVSGILQPIPTSTMTGPKTTSGLLGASVLQKAIETKRRDAMPASPLSQSQSLQTQSQSLRTGDASIASLQPAPNQKQANNNPDLFFEEIRYNNPYSSTGVPGQLNGNISAVSWQVKGRDKQAYGYRYDDLDRLTQADYYDIQDPGSMSVWSIFSADNKFQEKQTYDVRGNITSLQRRGMLTGSMTVNGQAAGTFGAIDDLTYTYQPDNLNRLATVTDAANTAVGFTTTSGTGAANAYDYDDNGNLKQDLNKGISNILYNYINLPMVITFTNGNQLLFTYDAAGNKLIKAKSNYYPGINPIINNDRYYVGGVEYANTPGGTVAHPETALIDIIQNAEGFAKRDVSGSYSDNYILRDHLDNTRVVFSDKNNDGVVDATDIVQVNAYYPFGLNHGANINGAGGAFKYQYNGKELNDDFGLNWNDYGARFYDPAIGRWHATDPLAEMYISYSPYGYVRNNPVGRIDIDGMKEGDPIDGGMLDKEEIVCTAKRPDKNPASSTNAGTPSGVFNGSGGSLPSRSSSQPNQPDWRPDSDGNLIAEQGDNIETLAKYLNITRASAQLMIDKQAIEYESKGSKNIKEGSKLTLDNVYTRSIKNVSDVDYNCWGAAVAGSKGRMIQQGVGIPSGDIFDNILKRDYFPINSSTNLKFGASVFRFVEPSTNIVQHGAVFYGLDHALNIYVYTKNGWHRKPTVMKISDLLKQIPSYGKVSGINQSDFGMYNPR